MTTVVRALAKVNLYLRVLGRRADGFHEIDTVLHAIDLGDEIALERDGSGIEVAYEGARIDPNDDLVAAAARAAGADGLRIRVEKKIPVGAGLGGGSSDAAAVLRVLMPSHEPKARGRIAAGLGSDVPYFVYGGTARARGRGEDVVPLACPGRFWFVLGIDDQPLPTSSVYAEWTGETGPLADALVAALAAGDGEAVGALVHNDLESAAFSLRPELRRRKDVLARAGVAGACLSGSGPTLFGLCTTRAAATRAAARVEDVFHRVEVVASAGPDLPPAPDDLPLRLAP